MSLDHPERGLVDAFLLRYTSTHLSISIYLCVINLYLQTCL